MTPTGMLTRHDLAQRWNVHVNHVDNLRRARRGPTEIRIGSAVRFRLADVEAWEDSTAAAGS